MILLPLSSPFNIYTKVEYKCKFNQASYIRFCLNFRFLNPHLQSTSWIRSFLATVNKVIIFLIRTQDICHFHRLGLTQNLQFWLWRLCHCIQCAKKSTMFLMSMCFFKEDRPRQTEVQITRCICIINHGNTTLAVTNKGMEGAKSFLKKCSVTF